MSIPLGSGVAAPDALGDLPVAGAGPDTQPPAGDAVAAPMQEPRGELLDADGKTVCDRLKEMWQSRDNQLKPLIAQWDANELIVQGVPGVRAVYDPASGWFARVPNSATERMGPSRTWELIGKTTATILADAPVPEVEPAHDTDPERSAAELATLILKNEQTGQGGLNLEKRAELASNLAGTHGSAFDYFTVDPKGGGWCALEVQAHPAATMYDDADPGAVTRDPVTGEESERYESRYVMPDGRLAASPVGARRVWRMGIRVQRLTGRQVRLFPATAEGIEDATSVIIATPISFGELCQLYPEIRDWTPEDQGKLVTWRPVPLSKIVPRDMGIVGDGKAIRKTGPNAGRPEDEAIVVTLTFIARSHASYPGGAFVVAAGGEFALVQQEQLVVIEEGDYACEEQMMLPLAQCEAYSDPKGGNPYGLADAEFLGPTDEIRQQIMLGMLDRVWQLNNRNCFVDVSSNLTPGALALRDGTPLETDLRAGPPVWEDVPPLEPEQRAVYELLGREQDSRVGLEAAAQGVSTPEVQSGRHAQVVVEQALVALTQRKRNLDAFIMRSWRIVLQLLRAYASTPQLLKYPSDDDQYKVREWKNTDLGSAKDVRIARGTGTMLTRTAKMNLAQQDLATAIETGNPMVVEQAYSRYERVTSGNVNPLLGIEEDPHRMRVRRQIAEYMKGPPELRDGSAYGMGGMDGMVGGAPPAPEIPPTGQAPELGAPPDEATEPPMLGAA